MIKYIYFVYYFYIIEEWSDLNWFGKISIAPFWFIRSIFMILFSIVCFPLVLLHMWYESDETQQKIEEFNNFILEELYGNRNLK